MKCASPSAPKVRQDRDETAPTADDTLHPPVWMAILCTMVLLGPLIVTSIMWIRLASYSYDWDAGEGDNLFYAWQLSQGQSPYGDYNHYPMTGSCYPPVYHLVLAPLVGMFGREVVLGRLVSWLAMLGTAALIGYTVLAHTSSRWAMLWAALLYLGSPTCRLWASLARVDSVSTFLGLAAFVVLAVGPPSRIRSVGGALLAVAAVYTKPYGVFLAAAGLVILATKDFYKAVGVAVISVILGLATLVLCHRLSGGWFWFDTVRANATDHEISRMLFFQFRFLTEHAVVVVLALFGVLRAAWPRRFVLLAVIVASLGISLFTGKLGACANYHLPLIAALCIAAGYAMGKPKVARDALLIPVALLVQGLSWTQPPEMLPGPQPRQAMDQLAAAIRAIPGPSLIERHVSLQYKTSNEMLWEPCLLSFLWDAGKWDPAELVKDIDAGRFGSVVTSGDFLVPPVQAALQRAYRPRQAFTIYTWDGETRYILLTPIRNSDVVN